MRRKVSYDVLNTSATDASKGSFPNSLRHKKKLPPQMNQLGDIDSKPKDAISGRSLYICMWWGMQALLRDAFSIDVATSEGIYCHV